MRLVQEESYMFGVAIRTHPFQKEIAMKALSKPAIIGFLLVFFLAGYVLADIPKDKDSTEPAASSKRCIRRFMINETEVIDDQTIVFHMLNNKAWKNTLPRQCPQLKIEDRFAYRTSLDRLCNVDIIKVMNHGVSCGLGMFEPYSEADKENSDENGGPSEQLSSD